VAIDVETTGLALVGTAPTFEAIVGTVLDWLSSPLGHQMKNVNQSVS
jgi:hypothetical protein